MQFSNELIVSGGSAAKTLIAKLQPNTNTVETRLKNARAFEIWSWKCGAKSIHALAQPNNRQPFIYTPASNCLNPESSSNCYYQSLARSLVRSFVCLFVRNNRKKPNPLTISRIFVLLCFFLNLFSLVDSFSLASSLGKNDENIDRDYGWNLKINLNFLSSEMNKLAKNVK